MTRRTKASRRAAFRRANTIPTPPIVWRFDARPFLRAARRLARAFRRAARATYRMLCATPMPVFAPTSAPTGPRVQIILGGGPL